MRGVQSKHSKAPSLLPRYSCGFWGSSKTMNPCSKCFDTIFSKETTRRSFCPKHKSQANSPSQQPLPTELNVTSPKCCGTDLQPENDASPVKGPPLLQNTEPSQETSRSKQKSLRWCSQCQTKLQLVQQELGWCRCGYVLCILHCLPEQHDCTFDHRGHGPEETIMKMVKLDQKVGRSCQRIGEGCS
uniref:AN1-type domain-containing protein n=1 Tax=Equus asinus TaxID=9793 RepID=A0A9L0JZ69_EQUAS